MAQKHSGFRVLTTLAVILALACAAWSEKGHLPPPPEENYNSMILDYIVTGAFFHKKTYSDDWTREYRYEGKLDPSFGGKLRVSGHAQWLTYPGPEAGYPWTVSVSVTAGNRTERQEFSPKTRMQDFDVSVPIGNSSSGSFAIRMTRSSNAGSRNMGALGTIEGRVDVASVPSQGQTASPGSLSSEEAKALLARELGSPKKIAERQVLYTGNDGGVFNGGNSPRFRLNRRTRIGMIMNFHYNEGKGAPAGTIALRSLEGKLYGPFKATAVNGVYWVARAGVELPPGDYVVIDSHPQSWSQNGPARLGHTLIKSE
ncbi:MAG: hypothetical protein U0931_24380 [Vulcanimicrobiota bacterium]